MPTKHIDDASFTLAEETLVKAVVLTKMAVKESEVLSLLIHKGAETITPVDILTRLGASPTAWADIFNHVLDECGAHYPQEYIDTEWVFREKAEKHSATWKEYNTDAIHQHICDAGKRRQKLGRIKFLQLAPDSEIETEEEKQRHEEWLSEQVRKMDDALGTVDGSALGSLSDDQRKLLELMMESDKFQVRFVPLPGQRRSDERYDFTVHTSRFPDAAQARLVALLGDLKNAGLQLTWHRSALDNWLQEHRGDNVQALVINLFISSDERRFTYTGDGEQAAEAVKKCLKTHGIDPLPSGAVTATLERTIAADQP